MTIKETFLPVALLLVFLLANPIACQSNYASHANNVEYTGDGLPEEATLDGKVSGLANSKETQLNNSHNLNIC